MESYNWIDITNDFIKSTETLALGELFHDKNFGLLEAMSAIEMMDPKMDAGMMCNQVNRKVVTFKQAIEDKLLKLSELSASELIGIIDCTTSCLVTWLEGHSLAQTVFTNLYLHDYSVIEDASLKAFSLCILKVTNILKDRISRAGIYEEEDFQPMTYGFSMAFNVADAEVTSAMKDIEDDLNRQIKSTRYRAGETRDESVVKQHEESLAIFYRIKFYRLFFIVLMNFVKEKYESMSQSQKLIDQLLELIPDVQMTVSMGIEISADEQSIESQSIMGFEPLVNQRLLPPTFPRYTKIKGRYESYEYMSSVLKQLQSLCTLTSMTSLHSLLEFYQDLSQQHPSIVVRSLSQLMVISPSKKVFNIHLFTDFLKDTINSFIAPPSLSPRCTLYNNPQTKEYVDTFTTHAAHTMSALFHITGHNRARQRDRWAHILDELSALQDEADKVDAYLHNILIKTEPNRHHLACYGTWVLYHTLQVMITYLLSGFELELYASFEYIYIFWYLYEQLYVWLTSSLQRAENFLTESETISEVSRGRNSRKNKKKKRQKPPINWEKLISQGLQQLCGGYFKALVGFTVEGRMKQTNFYYDKEEIRFSHRFAPFENVITPPMLHYAQFKEMTDCQQHRLDDIYMAACKCFHQARTLFETVANPSKEISNLITVAKTNFVVLKLMICGHRKDSKEPPEFEFSLSKTFPVIKIV